MASLSDVEDDDEDRRFLPPAVATGAVVEVEEQQRTTKLEAVFLRRLELEEEASLRRCLNGCEDTLHTFNASISRFQALYYLVHSISIYLSSKR